jgi:hypothetical protein
MKTGKGLLESLISITTISHQWPMVYIFANARSLHK